MSELLSTSCITSSPLDELRMFVVVSEWRECPCSCETDVPERTCRSCTVHPSHDEAIARAIAEASFCLLPSQSVLGRRCGMVEVMVPNRLLSREGSGLRWATDRLPELARRAGMGNNNISDMLDMAFSCKDDDLRRLSLLRTAQACIAASGTAALSGMLRAMSDMPAEAALALRPSVDAMLEATAMTTTML